MRQMLDDSHVALSPSQIQDLFAVIPFFGLIDMRHGHAYIGVLQRVPESNMAIT